MKFRERYRPELCVMSRDYGREHLQHVHLDVEKKRLAATNGHLMVFIPCEVEPNDVSGFVPIAAFKYARKYGADGERPGEWIEMRCRDRVECAGATFERPMPKAPFPPVDDSAARQKPGTAGTVTFAIDSRYLRRLATALGGPDEDRGGPAHVRLCVSLPVDPAEPMLTQISVVDNIEHEDRAAGTLMPCRATLTASEANVAMLAEESPETAP